MLKLLVDGYSYGIRSSRKLERATHHNLGSDGIDVIVPILTHSDSGIISRTFQRPTAIQSRSANISNTDVNKLTPEQLSAVESFAPNIRSAM